MLWPAKRFESPRCHRRLGLVDYGLVASPRCESTRVIQSGWCDADSVDGNELERHCGCALLHYAQALKAPRIRESAARLADQARGGAPYDAYVNRPGPDGDSDVPRVRRCRHTWFQATG